MVTCLAISLISPALLMLLKPTLNLNLNLMNNGLEKQSLLVAHILPEIIQFPFE